MKKQTLAIAAFAVSIAMTACSSKNTETEPATTAVVAESADSTVVAETTVKETEATETKETVEAETEEEILEDFVSGNITKINGSTLTVMDEFEEIERTFDISEASINNSSPLGVGDYVEIVFPEGEEGDVIMALRVEVQETAEVNGADPVMTGIILDMDEGTLTLEAAGGGVYEFTTGNAYIVTGEDGLESDEEVQITYLGEADEDDELMAVKIVAKAAYGTPQANINAIVGVVASVQDGTIVLLSESEDYLTFTSSKLDFSAFPAGTMVQITYEGSAGAKEIPATAIIAR